MAKTLNSLEKAAPLQHEPQRVLPLPHDSKITRPVRNIVLITLFHNLFNEQQLEKLPNILLGLPLRIFYKRWITYVKIGVLIA
jgi:hypothetical protein